MLQKNSKKWVIMSLFLVLLMSTIVSQYTLQEQGLSIPQKIGVKELLSSTPPPQTTALQLESANANSYHFNVVLDVDNASLSGTMLLNYTNFEVVSLEQLVFHVHPRAFLDYGGNLKINDLQLVGEHINVSSYQIVDETILEVYFNRSLLPLERIVVLIDFTTIIPPIADRFGYTLEPFEAYYLTNWYPVLAVYDLYGWDKSPYSFMGESFYYDMANYQLTVTVPTSFKVACSLPVKSQVIGSKRTIVFEEVWIRDLAFAASPSFATSSTTWEGITITSYYFDDALLAYRGALADELGRDALEIYSEAFGAYLWDTLAIVTFPGGGGMEYPGLVLIASTEYYNTSDVLYWEEVIVHEIAHQYFPFIIGTNSYLEPFIDEPFAVWTSVYFLEAQNRSADAAAKTDYRFKHYASYAASTGDFKLASSMAYWSSFGDSRPYFYTVYYKGFIVLKMLEEYLGLETFLQCLQAVYQTFAESNLYFTNFTSIFEETSGLDLDWFFSQWYFKTGLPSLSLTASTTDGRTIHITITNKNRDWFRLPLPLKISTPYETFTTIVWVNGSQTELSFTLTNETDEGVVSLAENMLLLRNFYQYPIQTNIIFETPSVGLPLIFVLFCVFSLLFWKKKPLKK